MGGLKQQHRYLLENCGVMLNKPNDYVLVSLSVVTCRSNKSNKLPEPHKCSHKNNTILTEVMFYLNCRRSGSSIG